MKYTYYVDDIILQKYYLQALIYCEPFINFNNKFINKIEILIDREKGNIRLAFNIFEYDNNIVCTILSKFKFNKKKLNKNIILRILNTRIVNCTSNNRQYFTDTNINEFLFNINQIINELVKWFYLLSFSCESIQVSDLVNGTYQVISYKFKCKEYINNILYTSGQIDILPVNDGFFSILFKFFNETNNDQDTEQNINIVNNVQLDNDSQLIEFSIDGFPDDFYEEPKFFILIPFNLDYINIDYRDLKRFLFDLFVTMLNSKESLALTGNASGFIYSLYFVKKFLNKKIKLIQEIIINFYNIIQLIDMPGININSRKLFFIKNNINNKKKNKKFIFTKNYLY